MIHRRLAALLLMLFAASAIAAPEVPAGILPDVATPLAYRLELTVVPERERFSRHAEIDVTLKEKTRSLHLHGRGLRVSRAHAVVAGRKIKARYREVEASGVARVDFTPALPAGTTSTSCLRGACCANPMPEGAVPAMKYRSHKTPPGPSPSAVIFMGANKVAMIR